MSLGTIANLPFTSPFGAGFQPFSSGSQTTSLTKENCVGGNCSDAPTTNDDGDLADFSGLALQQSHLSLRFSARSQIRTLDDGTIIEKSSARLKFHYELTTPDGQHVELNIKAKVRRTSIQTEDGTTIDKTRIKFQFSLLVEGVTEELLPLEASDSESGGTGGPLAGLQDFVATVEDVLGQFTDGSVSADELVAKTVDAFNDLIDAVRLLLGGPSEPAEPIESPLPGNGGPAPIAIEGSADSVAPPPLHLPAPTPPATTVADASPAPVVPAPIEEAATEETPSPEQQPPEAAPTDEIVAPAPAPEVGLPTERILQSVRLRFVESLTQILKTLSSSGESNDQSLTSLSYLRYQASLSLNIRTARVLDVNA